MLKIWDLYRTTKSDLRFVVYSVALTIYSYLGLLDQHFPIENEANMFLSKAYQTSLLNILWMRQYDALYPLLNVSFKLGANLIVAGGNIPFFAFMMVLQAVNLWLFFLLVRKHFLPLEERYPGWPMGGLASCAGGMSILLFAGFNAYYFVLQSPVQALLFLPLYFFLFNFYLIGQSMVESKAKGPRMPFVFLLLVSFCLPYFYSLPLLFLGILVLLWLQAREGEGRKQILLILGFHLVSVFIQSIFLDGRFSSISLIGRVDPNAIHRSGIFASLFHNPFLYFSAMVHNMTAALGFGLVFQNFLGNTLEYSFPYWVGGLCLLIYLFASFIPKADKGFSQINRVCWYFLLICLFSITLVRNSFNPEPDRLFDAFFVASQPRYYYLPSALMACSMVAVFFSLVIRLAKKEWHILSALVFLGLFAALNASVTRGKVDYAKTDPEPEIWRYVPERILRPPLADPARPSFLMPTKSMLEQESK